MTTGLRSDKLHVHPKSISAPLHGTLEDVADVQLSADLLQIDRLALVGECSVPADHERAADP